MTSKTIRGAFPAVLTSEQGYQDLLKRKNIQCLKDHDDNEIYEFAALKDGEVYTAGPALLAEAKEPSHELTKAIQERVWRSVLLIQEVVSDGMSPVSATALVWDVHLQSMYILVSLHFAASFYDACSTDFQRKISKYEAGIEEKKPDRSSGDVLQLMQVDDTGDESEVLTFKVCPDVCWKGSAKRDFCIFKVQLGLDWDCSTRGEAHRIDVPTVVSKRPKRGKSTAPVKPLAMQICKTPSISYDVTATQMVHVFGFPQVASGRFVLSTSVTAVRAVDFLLQGLSSEGLSGGAVIATASGKVVGYWGGGIAASKKEVFMSYGYKVDGLPLRASSQESSPEFSARPMPDGRIQFRRRFSTTTPAKPTTEL